WERLLPLCEKHQVEFRWVKGHAGNLENEHCDQLSCAALRQLNLSADEGYENKAEEGVRPAMQEGEPCRKCSTPVIKQTPRKKPKHDYYYEYYLLCPKCQTAYTVEEASGPLSSRHHCFSDCSARVGHAPVTTISNFYFTGGKRWCRCPKLFSMREPPLGGLLRLRRPS